ncbi:hypothetical protein Pure05_15910 [Paenarthrobacter ureafaciens]|nr:hypothetical protein Pure01_15910 [Paenarthrobacter ureafaciens]GLU63345.1 hypothetical protein Pure02_15950 [Paenarthrobacter ureafaciens]GLU71720.1 hypothetical protein Pure04_14350 [Paenarthrobacter ureafaciens]GLU76151.1 hypothetical protein Pure05_15910 [Paenarthrobacter ureafaciens]
MRLEGFGVAVGAGVPDGGTSPAAAIAPLPAGPAGEADALPGGSSGVVLSPALHADSPATTDAPKAPRTALLPGEKNGTAEGCFGTLSPMD